MTHPRSILRVDASMRHDGSTTRMLADKVIARIAGPETAVTTRDLTDTVPQIDPAWIAANFTDPEARTEAQKSALALSDSLIAEIKAADLLVLAVPMYNFGIPAAMKAWIDQICRARETFRYTETGPVGLLEGKRAIIVTASGGTETDSPIDYATPYLRHIMGFIGIAETTTIAAPRQMADADAAMAQAMAGIETLAA
ncbi:MAG: NAD(P)H-dependent oxidoreductase [Pseudomonadota bacterium]